jgi:hypothetical protein
MKSRDFQLPMIVNDDEVRNIESRLSAIPGVKEVHGNRPTKIFAAVWDDPATWDVIMDTLTEMGYTVKWQ